MKCASTFNKGSRCRYNAIYILEINQSTIYVCKGHALKEASARTGITFQSIDHIPFISDIHQREAPYEDCRRLLAATTGITIKQHGVGNTLFDGVMRYRVSINGQLKQLIICTKAPVMGALYDSMTLQIDALKRSKDIFVPTTDVAVGSQNAYVLSKFIKSQKVPYFYQIMTNVTTLVEVQLEGDSTVTFVKGACDLIQKLHGARLCFGDYNEHSLCFLEPNELETVRIMCAASLSFWMDKYGNYQGPRSGSCGSTQAYSSSRRVATKKAPCRFDDYESLLYLVLSVMGKSLPWNRSMTLTRMNDAKTEFLHMNHSCPSLQSICDMINNAAFDDCPNGPVLKRLFTELATTY